MVQCGFGCFATLASGLSVLALSSRFDGPFQPDPRTLLIQAFQYSLCRVVLMVPERRSGCVYRRWAFSTRSVESF